MQAPFEISLDALTIATLLLNFCLAALVGAVLTSWQIGSADSAWSRWRHQRQLQLRRLMLISSAGIVTVMIALLVIETATIAELRWYEVFSSIPEVLTSTHFGRTWIAGMCLIVLNLLLNLLAASHLRTLLGMLLLAGFVISRSLVSHAVSAGAFSWQVAIDASHLLLVSVWLGEVLIGGFVMLHIACGPSPDDRRDCGRYVAQLSTSATIALAGILVTGIINSWRGIGSVAGLQHLTDNAWGWVLLFKISGVAVAAVFGALNRWGALPDLLLHLRSSSLASVPAQRRFALTLQIETLVLTAVLFAAAMLTNSAPPA